MLYRGNTIKDVAPITTIDVMFDIQTIHPKAVPTVKGTANNTNIPAMAAGYVPKPLFVKAKVKLPTTNAIIIVLKGMLDVSVKACVAV